MQVLETIREAGYTIIDDKFPKVEIVASPKNEQKAIGEFREFLRKNNYYSTFGIVIKRP